MLLGDDHRVVGAASGLAHEALLYRTEDEYLASTVPFVERGLRAGEPVLIAVPAANLNLLGTTLGDAADRVRFADMTEAGRNPGRIIPWVLHAFIDEHAGQRVRVIGEQIWPGRTETEYPACAQHEALINVALARREASILCPYDAAGLTVDVLHDAGRTHPVMADAGARWSSAGYQPEVVVGDYNRPLSDVPADAVTMDFEAAHLPGLREAAAGYAVGVGLSERRVLDLQLAVSELAANAVSHGGGHGTLWMWTEAGSLACQVHDPGRASQPLIGRVPPAAGSEGGRGLVLVHYLSDLVRVHTTESAGTSVRLYLAL